MLINRVDTIIDGVFALQKHTKYSHLAFTTAIFFVVLFLSAATILTDTKRAYAADDLTITLTSSEVIDFHVVPNTFGSGSVSFTAGTTDNAGYGIYLKTNGLNLINQDVTSAQITPITLPAGNTTGILSTDFAIDTYGYSLNNQDFHPLTAAATMNGQNIAQTNTAGSNNYTITYGVRAGLDTVPGEYDLTVEILAIANQHAYIINYDANTTDRSLANMPSVNPEEGLIGTDMPITLPNAIPTRNEWTFVGWDTDKNLNPATNSPAYAAGGQIIPSFTDESAFSTTLYAIWTPKTYNVVFHSNFIAEGASEEDNSAMPTVAMPYPTKAKLPRNLFTRTDYHFLDWNTRPDGSGTIYVDQAEVIRLAQIGSAIHLYAHWVAINDEFSYEGTCTFSGPGDTTITGTDCSNYDEGTGYLNTGVMPFTVDTINKNFELKFTLGDNIDLSVIDPNGNYGGVLVNSIYEFNDSQVYYPGFAVRVRNGLIQIQARTGYKSENPAIMDIDAADIFGKQVRIMRHIDNLNRSYIYVQIGDNTPVRLLNATNMATTFNVPITIGAAIDPTTGESIRELTGNVNDFSFKYLPDGISYEELIYGENYQQQDDEDLTEVFFAAGPCTFNGNNELMVGENCVSNGPTNGKFINTGVNLFTAETIGLDFIIDVDLGSDYATNTQPDTQATIIGNEYPANNYPGITVRRNNNKIEVTGGQRTGQKTKVSSTYTANQITHISLMRRNGILCYSFNNDTYQRHYDFSTFTNFFDQPLYFGAASANTDLEDPTSQRTIKGTLSNMSIKVGKIGSASPDCKFE